MKCERRILHLISVSRPHRSYANISLTSYVTFAEIAFHPARPSLNFIRAAHPTPHLPLPRPPVGRQQLQLWPFVATEHTVCFFLLARLLLIELRVDVLVFRGAAIWCYTASDRDRLQLVRVLKGQLVGFTESIASSYGEKHC